MKNFTRRVKQTHIAWGSGDISAVSDLVESSAERVVEAVHELVEKRVNETVAQLVGSLTIDPCCGTGLVIGDNSNGEFEPHIRINDLAGLIVSFIRSVPEECPEDGDNDRELFLTWARWLEAQAARLRAEAAPIGKTP